MMVMTRMTTTTKTMNRRYRLYGVHAMSMQAYTHDTWFVSFTTSDQHLLAKNDPRYKIGFSFDFWYHEPRITNILIFSQLWWNYSLNVKEWISTLTDNMISSDKPLWVSDCWFCDRNINSFWWNNPYKTLLFEWKFTSRKCVVLRLTPLSLVSPRLHLESNYDAIIESMSILGEASRKKKS